jgi:hypothetical protein
MAHGRGSHRHVRGHSWLVWPALCAIALAGCGSSHKGTTAARTPTVSAPRGAPPPPPGGPPGPPPAAARAIAGRTLRAGDLPGFAPRGDSAAAATAASWVRQSETEAPPAERSAQVALLKRLGFLAGVEERLEPSGGGEGESVSVVEHFASPSGARAEQQAQVSRLKKNGLTAYTVASIPGAEGLVTGPGAFTGLNVAFTRGAYFYLVGLGYPTRTSPPPATGAQLTTAAQRLYARVSG